MELPLSWLTPLLILAGLLLLLPYVLAPLLIRFTLRQSAEPELEIVEADDPDLPEPVVRHFRKVTKALRPLGFDVVEGMALPYQTPRVRALVLLFANRSSKEVALATVMYAATVEGQQLQTAYVEFVARFRDGTLVQTNNSAQLGAFKRRSNCTTTQFPMVRDAARLYQLHKALAERHGGDSGKTLVLDEQFDGDGVDYLAWAIVQELDGQLETGYMYRARNGRVYRPTWKGACLMTWGQLWPIKAIRRARREAKARNLLAELEE